MRSAYNETWLRNLGIAKEAKQWRKQDLISAEQYAVISTEYKAGFYHPNLIIRILLCIATLIALAGVTGLLILMVADASENAIFTLCFVNGIGSFVVLEAFFIKNNNHYKSGVTEALLYHSIGFTIGGIVGMSEAHEMTIIVGCLIIFSFAAFRYLDLICTICALCSFGYLIFYQLYNAGDGIVQHLIPVAFLVAFTPLYFFFKKLRSKPHTRPWGDCLILLEALSLHFIYAAGNYLVVRELSLELMNLYLEPGQDIPFAWLFYGLTVGFPFLYLYFGIKNKDIVLLRVSLAVLAFSVFTFKYYYSLGHPEFSFTASGAILLIISWALFRHLRTPKNGFTRENVMTEKWANMNPEAFIISQTLGGNKVAVDEPFQGKGGAFGGGGASGDY